MKLFFITVMIGFIYGCSGNNAEKTVDKTAAQESIRKAESDFEKMAAEKGIAEAFWFFADSGAVIKRGNDSLVKGKEGIRQFYSAPYFSTAKVHWSPGFIDVSADGTLGYTYGNYLWISPGKDGKPDSATGVFHTVWKKQTDGNWRYVWD